MLDPGRSFGGILSLELTSARLQKGVSLHLASSFPQTTILFASLDMIIFITVRIFASTQLPPSH